jgi:hypothetical protein
VIPNGFDFLAEISPAPLLMLVGSAPWAPREVRDDLLEDAGFDASVSSDAALRLSLKRSEEGRDAFTAGRLEIDAVGSTVMLATAVFIADTSCRVLQGSRCCCSIHEFHETAQNASWNPRPIALPQHACQRTQT